MTKKVIINKIEILTEEGNSAAQRLLGLVESGIDRLRSDLGPVDENFHVSIDMEVIPNHPVRNNISIKSLSNNGTREKLMHILEKSANPFGNNISGNVRVDLQVKDV